jgi:hypothetical protein
MTKLILVLVSAIVGSVLTMLFIGSLTTVRAGGGAPSCSSANGDVNADGKLDLTDAVTILGHLFLGSPTELVPLCKTPGAAAGLAASGQIVCYRTDDDENWIETENRFVDNLDGTVTDNCTGLRWQKNWADVDGDGSSTDQDSLEWCEALAYCENLSFADHDDWRMPNVRELQSIADYGHSDPAMDPVFRTIPDYYWSSSSYADDPTYAWQVDFYDGVVDIDTKDEVYYVRAVRD